MNITRTYKVAGHTFSLSLPDSEKLWSALSPQYEPFAVETSEEDIFSLEYVEDIPAGVRVCVYDAPTEPGETVVKLFRFGDDWIFETHINDQCPLCATIWASADFRKAKMKLETRRISDALFGINNAAMLLFAFSTASLDTLEFHASVIENAGYSYLFLGKSGTGKSTHSRMWLESIEGSVLMNDDNPIVRIMPDGSVVAFGSPWSGKTPCYKNVQAPIAAFVQICQAPANTIRRQSVLEAFSSIYSSISGIKDDGSELSDGLNASMDKVISAVPCYVLGCLPDHDAARVCHAAVTPKK